MLITFLHLQHNTVFGFSGMLNFDIGLDMKGVYLVICLFAMVRIGHIFGDREFGRSGARYVIVDSKERLLGSW